MLKKRVESALNRAKQQKEKIKAVHDDDLEDFLESIGVLHDIQCGKEKCKFCAEEINMANLSTVFPDSGTISFICHKQECIRKFLTYYNEK